jgi:hypothetical protein
LSVIRRLHPNAFNKDVPNPWTGVTMKRRVKKIKAAVDRETVYEFAWKAIEAGHPESAAAAVVCFEWLQRPENVLAGCITWNDYRGNEALSGHRTDRAYGGYAKLTMERALAATRKRHAHRLANDDAAIA